MNAVSCLLCTFLLFTTAFARADERTPRPFDISPQSLASALSEFARQSEVEILFTPEVVAEKLSDGVRGNLRPHEALKLLIGDTGLVITTTPQGAILIQSPRAEAAHATGMAPDPDRIRLAQASEPADAPGTPDSPPPQARAPEPTMVAIPEVLVTGSKSLNMDIRRTRDDAQPYVVLDRKLIERSGATSIDALLKSRLPMNTVAQSNSQQSTTGTGGNGSLINLRGLGANQTLILIDGRRAASGFTPQGELRQHDLNGIPLAAIERIEILPATASGIYGGGATGGVVNVVLRRDYSGLEGTLSYDNTFDTDTPELKFDFAAGMSLEDGRTRLLLSGSYSDEDFLRVLDRRATQDNRYRLLANLGGNYQAFNSGSNPPLGATPNIRSSNGANLTLDDGTPLNSPITFVPAGYAGIAADDGAALVANAGRYNLDWAEMAARGSGIAGGGGYSALVGAPRVRSLNFTMRRQFSSRIEAFLETNASDNLSRRVDNAIQINGANLATIPADAPNNPFSQPILVTPPLPLLAEESFETEDLRASLGVIARLPGEWLAETDYVWNRSQSTYAPIPLFRTGLREAVTSGDVDVLRDLRQFPADLSPYSPLIGEQQPPRVTFQTATLRLAGPLFELPAGPVMLSSLIEYRDESIDDSFRDFINNARLSRLVTPSRSQDVLSLYLEARLPLLGRAGGAAPALELQLAVRGDEYNTHGVVGVLVDPAPGTEPARTSNKVRSVDPTVALRFQPWSALALRASFGTGFLPPNVNQLVSGVNAGPVGFADPRRGGALTSVGPGQVVTGGNPNLEPEESKSWSAGFIFTPSQIPDLRVSLDYTYIEKTGNISSHPAGIQGLVSDEAFFPDRVTRGPKLSTDPAEWAGPIIGLNTTLLNIARAEVEALDLALDQSMRTSLGTFELHALATWQTLYETQAAPSAPSFNNVGYSINSPLRFKANAGASWTRGALTVGWDASYFDSYRVFGASAAPVVVGPAVERQGNGGRVSSQIYHDAYAIYRFDSGPSGGLHHVLDGMDLTAGIHNVFDKEPPFDSSNFSMGYYSFYGDPRLSTYYVKVRKQFP